MWWTGRKRQGNNHAGSTVERAAGSAGKPERRRAGRSLAGGSNQSFKLDSAWAAGLLQRRGMRRARAIASSHTETGSRSSPSSHDAANRGSSSFSEGAMSLQPADGVFPRPGSAGERRARAPSTCRDGHPALRGRPASEAPLWPPCFPGGGETGVVAVTTSMVAWTLPKIMRGGGKPHLARRILSLLEKKSRKRPRCSSLFKLSLFVIIIINS